MEWYFFLVACTRILRLLPHNLVWYYMFRSKLSYPWKLPCKWGFPWVKIWNHSLFKVNAAWLNLKYGRCTIWGRSFLRQIILHIVIYSWNSGPGWVVIPINNYFVQPNLWRFVLCGDFLEAKWYQYVRMLALFISFYIRRFCY